MKHQYDALHVPQFNDTEDDKGIKLKKKEIVNDDNVEKKKMHENQNFSKIDTKPEIQKLMH